MAKQNAYTHQQIITDIKNGNVRPIYLLYGDEEYYIDLIANYIEDNLLNEIEKEFNLTTLYGKETDCNQIIMTAKQYPVMSKYQLIIVREAQDIKDLSNLSIYLKQPMESSVIVMLHKHGSVDQRKKVYGDIAKAGVLYESKRKYDNEIPGWITSYVQSKQHTIDPKAANLLAEFLGTSLTKITNEVDKLLILLSGSDQKHITPDLIERNIGISKDYNNFELINAIAVRDVMKVNRIISYFAQNPKNNPLVVTTSTLFNFFATLMHYHWIKDKSQPTIASQLKINPFMLKYYQSAARFYPSGKTLNAIEQLRILDAKSKGFDNSKTSDKDLLRETLYKIMH